MNTTTPTSLSILSALAAQQDYPAASLYIVATPIGNVADISLRALHTLALVDTIACEDTRHSKPLLHRLGLNQRPVQWLAVHEHNEQEASQTLIARLQQGERVAYISDAGTPAISDPGARLVAAVRSAGYRIIPLPGASSVTTLLSASGAMAQTGAANAASFVFQGFLPSDGKSRRAALLTLQACISPVVILEAPHRIDTLAKELLPFGSRPLTLGRELTKQFEEIATVACQDFCAWLDATAQRRKGEYSLVLHPAAVESKDDHTPKVSPEALRVLAILLQAGLGTKHAAKAAAEITGAAKNLLYSAALEANQD